MSESSTRRAAAVQRVITELRRHLEAGLLAGHYEFEVLIKPSGQGGREIIIGGGATSRFEVPAERAPAAGV